MHWLFFHDIPAMYGWLYMMGLWRSVIGILIAGAFTWVLRIGRRLRKIEHMLDTDRPGGLTDVVAAINQANSPPPDGKVN